VRYGDIDRNTKNIKCKIDPSSRLYEHARGQADQASGNFLHIDMSCILSNLEKCPMDYPSHAPRT